MKRFGEHEVECRTLIEAELPIPAYDQVLKASHAFNLLDARGAISVTERAAYIGRLRTLSKLVAQAYLASRKAMQPPYPMLSPEARAQLPAHYLEAAP